MSKLDIRLSYKNACILKHTLRNQIGQKESWIQANRDGVYNTLDKEIKELDEEKRALQAFTEEINECGYIHGRQIFGHEE